MTPDINEIECNGLVIAETIARHSRRPEVLHTHADRHLFAVPEGYSLQTDEHLAKLMPTPARKSGTVSLDTVESFIEYVKKHANDATTIWCKADLAGGQANFTAIFNDHQDAEGFESSNPGWRDFRAQFTPKLSVEWKTWVAQDHKRMSQAEFAIFIDDNLKDIASVEGRPTGSEMLELATRFEITQDKRFRSAVRLQSGGVNLEYVENDDEGTIDRMKMFDRFSVGIAPFWRGEGYRIDARLKYTLREGGLKLWYELVRPDIAFESGTESVIKQISEALERPVLFGNPQ